MAKNYILQFGSTTWSGLTPTFSVFRAVPGGGTTTAPGITELPTSSGLYYFTYDPQGPVAFVADGGASLLATSRYIAGTLDPIQSVDEKLGTTASSFGSTATDPSTVFGFLKRFLEFNEGNSVFTKSSGAWAIFARGNAAGASTGLAAKTLYDSGSVVTKA
jgi:hypothetical protein